MKYLISLISILFITSCGSSEYKLVGEIQLTDELLKYFPNELGDNFSYLSSNGDTIQFHLDESIFDDDYRWEDESHFEYYIVDIKKMIYECLNNNCFLEFNMHPALSYGIFSFGVAWRCKVDGDVTKSNALSLFPLYEDIDSTIIKNQAEHFDSITIMEKTYRNVIYEKNYQDLWGEYKSCNPNYDTCVSEFYYTQGYGLVKIVFSDGSYYELLADK